MGLPCLKPLPLYRPRDPQASDLWRLLDGHFEAFREVYTEGFQAKYGFWRPLHEADGKWFWWGAKGPEACKSLWRLMFTRFTVNHHLHNLIWVYTPANPTRDEWYPGDDIVDIIGLDAYPKSPDDLLVSKWQDLQSRYNGKKLVALTEFGGVPDIEAMHKAGVWWCYFSSWNRTLNKSPREMLIRTYKSPNVVTLEDLKCAPIRSSTAGP